MTPTTARLRHAIMRAAALALAESALRVAIGDDLRLTRIDDCALGAWRATWEHSQNRAAPWSWSDLRAKYASRFDRLEMAVWHRGALCGLALGRFSPARTVLQINFVEGSPDPLHPLKGYVLRIVVEAARVFGFAHGARLLRITDPSPATLRSLQRMGGLGFRHVAKSRRMPYDYCERVLQ